MNSMKLQRNSMDDIEEELIQLLNISSRLDVRLAALENIAGLTATDEGIELISSSKKLLPFLAQLSTKDQNEIIKRECLRIFINVLIDPHKFSSYGFLDNCFLEFLISYVLNKESKFADDAAKVLSNLTRNESCCLKILACIETLEAVSLQDFVDAFCIRNYNIAAELSHVGSFLSNMTVIEKARRLLLDKERCVIQRFLPYTVHMESHTRRAATVRILRNVAFETDYHDWLLSKDVDILPHLLLPLAGPEELPDHDMEQLPLDLQYLPSDKKREPDASIRCMLLETLLQLCTRKLGRDHLKDSGAYIIARELHRNEQNEKVNLALEQLIQILIGDEPEDEMENLKTVAIPADLQKQFQDVDKQNSENQRNETQN